MKFILDRFEDPRNMYNRLFRKEIESYSPFFKGCFSFPRFIGYLKTEKNIFYFNKKNPSCVVDILKKIDCLGKIEIDLKEYKMNSIEEYRNHRKNCVMKKTKTIYKLKKDKKYYYCLCINYYLCMCEKKIANSKSYLCKKFSEKEEANVHILNH